MPVLRAGEGSGRRDLVAGTLEAPRPRGESGDETEEEE